MLSEDKEQTNDLIQPWRDVWQRTSAMESTVAFLLIPFVLVAVKASVDSHAWALPLSAKSILQPEIFPLAFTSSYVHAGPSLLRGNVEGYLLIMTALFPLAIIAERKRELFTTSLFNLLIVPFLVSWASLILPDNKFALGFSGVNAAFLGTLLVFLFMAWSSERESVTPIWSLAPGLLSLSVAFAFAPIVSPRLPRLRVYVVGFGIVSIVLLMVFFRRIGVESLQMLSPSRNPVLFWGVFVSIVGFAALFVTVPPSTNVLAHLTGFYAGFFLPFSLLVGRTLNDPIVKKTRILRENF